MNDQLLLELYNNLYQSHFPRKHFPLIAQFYRSRALSHTIQLQNGTITIRIAESLKIAPRHILSALGLILLFKLFRVKADRELNRSYRAYIRENILPGLETARRKPSSRYSAVGNYYNLNELFDELNEKYFEGSLEKPLLGWSLSRSYARLGFYVAEKRQLVISKIFDSKKVPREVVEFLLYHEMLHIHIPVRAGKKRRIVHPVEFRRLEHSFPNYKRIEKWITTKRHRL